MSVLFVFINVLYIHKYIHTYKYICTHTNTNIYVLGRAVKVNALTQTLFNGTKFLFFGATYAWFIPDVEVARKMHINEGDRKSTHQSTFKITTEGILKYHSAQERLIWEKT